MDTATLISFALISLVFIAIPGPNILVIVSTSLRAGKVRGLQTVMGTSLAMILQLSLVALATSWILAVLVEGLFWLKWVGVAYLLFLGISSLMVWYRGDSTAVPSASSSFQRGFWVSLTNPKTLLFFSAFLPQFTHGNEAYLSQIFLLSLSFWILATLVDMTYALATASVKWMLDKRDIDRIQQGVSGIFYVSAAGILASSNRF